LRRRAAHDDRERADGDEQHRQDQEHVGEAHDDALLAHAL